MHETKLVIKTPVGPIEVVVVGDSEFPGVRIDFDQQQVARVEYNPYDDQVNAMLWQEDNFDDFTYLTTHKPPIYRDDKVLKQAFNDLQYSLDNIQSETPIYELTDELLEETIHQIVNVDHSDYNDHVQDIVRDTMDKMKTMKLDVAEEMAKYAHAGQKDLAGKPYIEHIETVVELASKIAPFEEKTDTKIVAYLHDMLEDTLTTKRMLTDAGFPEEIIQAVSELTRDEFETYDKYIETIKNPLAKTVKMADLIHNADMSRFGDDYKPSSGDYKRIKKYEKALTKLADSSQQINQAKLYYHRIKQVNGDQDE